MTDHDLATLLRDHVRNDEPPLTIRAGTVVGLGRRTVRRRRARRGAGGAVLMAASIATTVALVGPGPADRDDRAGLDPATATALRTYDAAAMPTVLDTRTRAALDGLTGEAAFVARDDNGQELPEHYWDKASSMSVSYGSDAHRFSVDLGHSRSEAEGSARRYCADGLSDGAYLRCEVTTSAAGDPVVSKVWALRPAEVAAGDDSMAVVARETLESGTIPPTAPVQSPLDRDHLYFARTVKVVHSETFVTYVEERVRARNLAGANAMWATSEASLVAVATDPVLAIPAPPIGEGNCPWTLPGSGVTCMKK